MTKTADAKTARVSVVIPNYNGKACLRSCLEHVGQSDIPLTLIVVDDGSCDGSADMVQAFFPDVKLIPLKRNTGFARAVNEGMKRVRTPYVFLLNNDAIVEKDTVSKLLSVLEKGTDLFSVQPLMLQKDAPDCVDSAGDYLNALGHAFAYGKDKPAERFTRRRALTSSCAGAALYRRDIMERLGGFDEAHFCYLEDVDLGVRARLKGYRNLFVPEARVFHVGSATSGARHNAFKVRLSAANSLYLLYKNLPALMLLINLPLFLLGIVSKTVFFAAKGLAGAYLTGLLDGLSKIRDNKEKKIRFEGAYLPQYVLFQIELWRNLFLRLTEG